MKKSIIYVLFCILFVSCSSGFEKKALDQCEKELSEAFKEDDGFEIEDKDIVFSDDSLCVIKLTINAIIYLYRFNIVQKLVNFDKF